LVLRIYYSIIKQIKDMKLNRPLIFIASIIMIVLIFHLSNKWNRYFYGIESIAKLYNIKSTGKTYYVQYFYYVDNIKYTSENQMGFQNKGKKGNFYKIVYSSKNSKNVEIYLDEPVTDTISILKAGFSRDEISKMPN
jgi:hypothetical protein